MIIRPHNLRELELQLRRIPKEKRKVIVLVGRHPNEGTLNLAVHHHRSWEDVGAVVIKIPSYWSPQFLWHDAKRRNLSWSEVKKKFAKTPDDQRVIRFLSRRGFQVPVVNFHSTPQRPDYGKFLLGYSLTSDTRVNVPFHLWNSNLAEHANELVVEYIFPGQVLPRSRVRDFVEKTAASGSQEKSDADYLDKWTAINRRALNAFKIAHAGPLKHLLQYLAEHGLMK